MWAAFHHLDRFAWVASLSGAYSLIPDAGITIPPPPNAADLRQPGITQSFDPDKLLASLPDLHARREQPAEAVLPDRSAPTTDCSPSSGF